MITLTRLIDMKFEFNIQESKNFMEQRDHIRHLLQGNKENVSFMSNLLVKVNNTFQEILKEVGYGEKEHIRSHFELIKRITNNFVFSSKYKYLAENFVIIANSYKELNLFLLKHKTAIHEKFSPLDIDFLRVLIIEISKLEYSIERRL